MRYNWKRDTCMSLLLACYFALHACSGDLVQTIGPVIGLPTLGVVVDSTTLWVGHVAHVSIPSRDTAGNPTTLAGVEWTSITPNIATVISSGAVTALSSGEAVIEGSVRGSNGRVKLKVFAELASHNFDNGTIGPFNNPWGVDLDFPTDPTGLGHGKVARFHYRGTAQDQNRALEFTYARRWGQPMYFKGEFNLPVDDLAAGDIIRKLIYWQPHTNYAKYTTNGGLATGRTVVHLSGSDLVVDATYNPASSTGKSSDDVRTVATIATGLLGNKWYTLEVFQQMETGIGRADGILRVWLDGMLIFDKTSMTWSDPAWVGNNSNSVPFEASDIYFEHFLVGQQVNWWTGSFDEYRYWDNVEFSTRAR
jgi:hypothetical protein